MDRTRTHACPLHQPVVASTHAYSRPLMRMRPLQAATAEHASCLRLTQPAPRLPRAANEKIAALEAGRVLAATSNEELTSTLVSEKANQEEIFEYLRGEIHKKNGQINELQDKATILSEELERLTIDQEQRLQAVTDRGVQEKAALQAEVRVTTMCNHLASPALPLCACAPPAGGGGARGAQASRGLCAGQVGARGRARADQEDARFG